jgi:hypothetical protein
MKGVFTLNKTMAFIDENGKRMEYEIWDELIINKSGYMIMSPKEDKNDLSVYKLLITKNGEQLELVEDKSTVDLVKSKSSYLPA